MLASPCGWYRFIVSPMMPAHLLVADAGLEPEVVHGHQNAPLDRLQAVADVRQRPADDDAHGVRQVAVAEFVLRCPARGSARGAVGPSVGRGRDGVADAKACPRVGLYGVLPTRDDRVASGLLMKTTITMVPGKRLTRRKWLLEPLPAGEWIGAMELHQIRVILQELATHPRPWEGPPTELFRTALGLIESATPSSPPFGVSVSRLLLLRPCAASALQPRASRAADRAKAPRQSRPREGPAGENEARHRQENAGGRFFDDLPAAIKEATGVTVKIEKVAWYGVTLRRRSNSRAR